MNKENLEKFFTGKLFRIPEYQRDYAWGINNVEDLFDDIIESIDTNTSHYLGTFILAKPKQKTENFYYVVDGQQRITTLTMLLNSLINNLGKKNSRIINKDKFIFSLEDDKYKLDLLGENSPFFKGLLEENKIDAATRSQKLLNEVYNYIDTRISAMNDERIGQFLNCIKGLEVLEFVEEDEGKAIRMFQTVNDRGKPLTNMEKAKSLLIYYSNRFLDGRLDSRINSLFGQIFKDYTEIKDFGEKNTVSTLTTKDFSEDSVMRYHYLAYDNDKYDYWASRDQVLTTFLKPKLKELSLDNDISGMEKFIISYIEDLSGFFKSFKEIMTKVDEERYYYKFFSVLNVSAILYPLIIRLNQKGILEENLSVNNQLTFIQLIEIADVRVYKTRGTDPQKDMFYLARFSNKFSNKEIENRLISFINQFMNDRLFKNKLEEYIYGKNQGLSYIFLEYSEYLKENKNKERIPLIRLKDINSDKKQKFTIEHIFSQEPSYDFPNRNFDSREEYDLLNNKLGNLTLLKKNVNSRCRDKTPEEKILNSNDYIDSPFEITCDLASRVKNRGRTFAKDDIEKRTEELSEFCLKRWQYKERK